MSTFPLRHDATTLRQAKLAHTASKARLRKGAVGEQGSMRNTGHISFLAPARPMRRLTYPIPGSDRDDWGGFRREGTGVIFLLPAPARTFLQGTALLHGRSLRPRMIGCSLRRATWIKTLDLLYCQELIVSNSTSGYRTTNIVQRRPPPSSTKVRVEALLLPRPRFKRG